MVCTNDWGCAVKMWPSTWSRSKKKTGPWEMAKRNTPTTGAHPAHADVVAYQKVAAKLAETVGFALRLAPRTHTGFRRSCFAGIRLARRGRPISRCAGAATISRLGQALNGVDGRPVSLTDIHVPIFAVGTPSSRVAASRCCSSLTPAPRKGGSKGASMRSSPVALLSIKFINFPADKIPS
jgi:hypothetical protein